MKFDLLINTYDYILNFVSLDEMTFLGGPQQGRNSASDRKILILDIPFPRLTIRGSKETVCNAK